ncbi:MAG: hypothetical protein V3T08_09255 [Gemmatimonadota bacterium]
MAAVETQTEIEKRRLIEAVQKDLDNVTESLKNARGIIGALVGAAKGLDQGLVTACTGWGKNLDVLLNNITDEGSAVGQRMGGNGGPKIVEHVDRPHTEAVVAAASREKVSEEAGV